jgi:GntR family transcriptional repressor for pyruvate dehydrogenase complex
VSVTSQAIETIRAMIIDGRLRAGDQLPPEQELADTLGISRGSLREAVQALAHIKVLEVRRGDGTYIGTLEPQDLLSSMVFAIDLASDDSVYEVLEVRRLLFPQTAALAAQRVTDEQLEQLRGLLQRLDASTSADEIIELHDQFADVVADATGNSWLTNILRALHSAGDSVRRTWLHSDPILQPISIAYQRQLLRALENHDVEMARSVATVAVEARREWLDHVREHKEGPMPIPRVPL